MAATALQSATDIDLKIRKRDNRLVDFELTYIENALQAAFDSAHDDSLGHEIFTEVKKPLLEYVLTEIQLLASHNEEIEVEAIQDLVENALMKLGHYKVAKRYIVYRENRSKARSLRGENKAKSSLKMKRADGSMTPIDTHQIKQTLYAAAHELENVSVDAIITELFTSIFNGITEAQIGSAMIMVARSRIEQEHNYSIIASRLLLNQLYTQVMGSTENSPNFVATYISTFKKNIERGVEARRYSSDLLGYDFGQLEAAMKPERDHDFQYLGLQTIFDRYLIHIEDVRIEAPQYFWMRVAMGLALNEDNKEVKAIEFYETLSQFHFVSATPTLFNSGTCHPQLSSCYLSTVEDDLSHIFKVIGDNASLSKWAGGLGNDWTNIRATGAHIDGTNGKSQGVIPFLKIVSDTALAVNQGGKRKGAVCSYMEVWHYDIQEFVDLRKNTGDERRRTHDMHTAAWVPDLFMQRVKENKTWMLFSPDEVPELHHIYSAEFDAKYEYYEKQAEAGNIKLFKEIQAVDLWRKMLSMLFETGHPWITYKDPSNVRSPQGHVGTVHNSNLCTEILLNTSKDETAVCNLGSVNLSKHTKADGLDEQMIKKTVKTAIRMLDNVIDINFYPIPEAKNSNTKHRPIGLGVMGFQEALYIQKMSYESAEAIEFADSSTEMISYYAIEGSSDLAKERSPYSSYEGSKWHQGKLPIDTLADLVAYRGKNIEVDQSTRMDWNTLRAKVKEQGMRNSNVMAIAPTATISNISGCTQSIEPTYRNLYVKSNLSGDFTIVNKFLIDDLKALNIWDDQMIDDLKYYDGSLLEIERIPENVKDIYKTAFEIDIECLVEANSRRQKWIDMGISMNLYIDQPSGKKLNEMYMNTWMKGLKTTYYLRSVAATQIEKSNIDLNKRSLQPRWMKSKSATAEVKTLPNEINDSLEGLNPAANACSIDNPDCESCQ